MLFNPKIEIFIIIHKITILNLFYICKMSNKNTENILTFLREYIDTNNIDITVKNNYNELLSIALGFGYNDEYNDCNNDDNDDEDDDYDEDNNENVSSNNVSSNNVLKCYNNYDISIDTINDLDEYYNNIPEAVITFWATSLKISLLPILPKYLYALILFNNNISHIDIELPKSIKIINLDNNDITELPDNLPDGLEELYINNNKLSSINKLPNGLKIFGASNNEIYQINMLPPTLEKCIVNNNKISYMPDLPQTMKILKIHNNDFDQIPYLNNELTYITCHNNPVYNNNRIPNKVIKIIKPIQHFD